MNTSFMIISNLISTLLIVVWFFLFLRYKNSYNDMIETIDGKIFTLKEIYFVGLGAIEIYENVSNKRICETEKAVMKISHLAEVFGKENAELYYYISTAATVSLTLTLLPVGLMTGPLLGTSIGYFLGLALAAVLTYGVTSSINASVERKKDAIINEFPHMVSKLTMLLNAGMLVRRAWDEVANSNMEEPLYEEMRITSKDIMEGVSIEKAMEDFASRCAVKQIRKFSSIYVQAVIRSASEAVDSMKVMADEAWQEKKNLAKQRGEKANSKLLIPNMLMLFGIIIVVVVPLIASMMGSVNL